MKLPASILAVLSLVCAVLGVAIKPAEPGWKTELITMPDGSTETLYTRDTFVPTDADHLDATNSTPYSNVTWHAGNPTGNDIGGCGVSNSSQVNAVTWFKAVDRMDCFSMLYQMSSQMHWDGLDGRSGQYWSLIKDKDCEVGATRKDGGSNTITIRGSQLGEAITEAIHNDALADENGQYALEGEMECPNYNNTCFTWTIGNTNFRNSSQRPVTSGGGWEKRAKAGIYTKIAFASDYDKGFCEAPVPYRAPWIPPAQVSQCLELGNQILNRPGYWKGWDWDGGVWQLARLADCEFGIGRTDGLTAQTRIGNLDVGNLIKYASNSESGFVAGDEVQVGGSMRCLGAYMSFSVGNTRLPIPKSA